MADVAVLGLGLVSLSAVVLIVYVRLQHCFDELNKRIVELESWFVDLELTDKK